MGTKGQTSVAPKRGCSPICLLISISSDAFFINLKAASMTFFGSPTKVITVLLVAFPGSTSSNFTPSTVFTIFAIVLILLISLPSLILGTHSISCIFMVNKFFD